MSAISMRDTLISRDSKGKIRQINIACEWNEAFQMYVITRQSGLYKGKMIVSPNIEIAKGKAKRTITEQATLEYNSNVKSYLDKGYKNIKDFGFDNIDQFNPDKVYPKSNTDTKGVGKPMLCKILDKSNKKLTDRQWYGSFKLDGVRSWIYNDNGVLKTSSRGGKDYNIPATYILQDEYINKLLKENPNLILDGEIYRHGWGLNRISGLCRLTNLVDEHKELSFFCYDIVDENTPFKDRLKILAKIRNNAPNGTKLVVIEHVPVQGLDAIMKEHDRAVSLGYEGLVIRDPEQNYKCDARDNRMLKIKEMDTTTFKIIGYELGLRGAEDMCFVLETPNHKSFKAKPEGDLSIKEYYIQNIDTIIGKPGDVRFFHYTPYGIPNLPVFVAIRDDLTV